MWIVSFSGGLGNQMFQYGFYKTLFELYPDIVIKADIMFMMGLKEHNGYELEKIFGIQLPECTKLEALRLSEYCRTLELVKLHPIKLLYKIRKKIIGHKKTALIQKKATEYMPIPLEMDRKKSYIFMGNWINERYFFHIAEKLREDFQFKIPLDENSRFLKSLIDNSKSVSVHVRRTDYVASSLDILSMKYYKKAIGIIEEKVDNATYFIFSDDKDYIRENFSFLNSYYIVEKNCGENSYRDMQLMSYCKHNIIANSTFSYWGAFLNSNPDKIVVSPTHIAEDMEFPKVCENDIRIECE